MSWVLIAVLRRLLGVHLDWRSEFLQTCTPSRYLDWFVTTPLILLNLGMIVGADMVTIIAICAADMLMIFGGFMGSVSSGHIKWLWFSLSLLIFAPIVYVPFRPAPVLQHSHSALVSLGSRGTCEMWLVSCWVTAADRVGPLCR